MSTSQLDAVSVKTQANVFFDGRCISHSVTLADGSRKSVGVILGDQTLSFNIGAAEVMECVAGACEYRLQDQDLWQTSSAGQRFAVPAHTRFDIRLAPGTSAYHYICHFA